MANVRPVIVGIDGTLIESVDLHARAWVEAFAALGYKVGFEQVRGPIGNSGDTLLPEFLTPEQIEADRDDLEQRRAELMKERYVSRIRTFSDVRALFERLLADGKQIALASSAKED